MSKSITNHWPSTQLCMECEHGILVLSDDEPTYVCSVGIKLEWCESKCEEQSVSELPPLGNDPIDW